MTTPLMPFGDPAPQRDLHVIFWADCSGSMVGEKIAKLNAAIEAAIGPMQQAAAGEPRARVLVRAVRFSSTASWHVATPTPLAEFRWHELEADGETAMGAAIDLAVQALDDAAMAGRQFPPVLVLVSDGQATDDPSGPIARLLQHRLGRTAVRRAIAIGHDVDLPALQRFIANAEIAPMVVERVDQLARALVFATVSGLSESTGQKSAPPTADPYDSNINIAPTGGPSASPPLSSPSTSPTF